MKIHLHLGVHKTASTFIQNWLFEHNDQLFANDICYIPLEKIRSKITNAIEFSSGEIAQVRENLYELIESQGYKTLPNVLIISDENILGSPGTIGKSGLLYPDFKKRAQALAELFTGHDVYVFLSIRSYDSFYPSIYAELFRHGYVNSFENFVNNLDITKNSWISVMEIIKFFFGEPYIWKYEDFTLHYQKIITKLSTLPIHKDDVNIKRIVRQSLPMKAINVALASKGFLTQNELKKLISFLATRMQYEFRGPKIAFYDTELINFLQDKYNRECKILGLIE